MIVPPLLAILIAMAAVLNRMHCPMRHVQGYTPKPLDAAVGQLLRATSNKTMMTNAPTLLSVLMAVVVCRWFMAFL